MLGHTAPMAFPITATTTTTTTTSIVPNQDAEKHESDACTTKLDQSPAFACRDAESLDVFHPGIQVQSVQHRPPIEPLSTPLSPPESDCSDTSLSNPSSGTKGSITNNTQPSPLHAEYMAKARPAPTSISFHQRAAEACMPFLRTAASLGHDLAFEWGYPAVSVVPLELASDIAKKLRAMQMDAYAIVFTGEAIERSIPMDHHRLAADSVVSCQPNQTVTVVSNHSRHSSTCSRRTSHSSNGRMELDRGSTNDLQHGSEHELMQLTLSHTHTQCDTVPTCEGTTVPKEKSHEDDSNTIAETATTTEIQTNSSCVALRVDNSDDHSPSPPTSMAAATDPQPLQNALPKLDIVFILSPKTSREQLFQTREVTMDALFSFLPESARRKSRHMVAAAYMQNMNITPSPVQPNDDRWSAFTLHACEGSPVIRIKFVAHSSKNNEQAQLVCAPTVVMAWAEGDACDTRKDLVENWSEIETRGIFSNLLRQELQSEKEKCSKLELGQIYGLSSLGDLGLKGQEVVGRAQLKGNTVHCILNAPLTIAIIDQQGSSSSTVGTNNIGPGPSISAVHPQAQDNTSRDSVKAQGAFHSYAVKIHELFHTTSTGAAMCMHKMCFCQYSDGSEAVND